MAGACHVATAGNKNESYSYSHVSNCPKIKNKILFYCGDMYRNSRKKDAIKAYTLFEIYSESDLKRFWLKNFFDRPSYVLSKFC